MPGFHKLCRSCWIRRVFIVFVMQKVLSPTDIQLGGIVVLWLQLS